MLSTRAYYRSDRLITSDWEKLAANVRAFKPDVVVMLARKMPRLRQVAQEWMDFGQALVVSDFAIAWMHADLAGKRIAVLDDAINLGTTLRHVCMMLTSCHVRAIGVFAVAAKQHDANDDDSLFRDYNVHVCNSGLTSDAYHQFANHTALALSLLPKPYEIEFPVLRATYSGDAPMDVRDIFAWLEEHYGADNVHSLLRVENNGTGLARFSIDMQPGSLQNTKIRLYIDEATGIIRLVPMVHFDVNAKNKGFLPQVWEAASQLLNTLPLQTESFGCETQWRLQQYLSSLRFGLTVVGELSAVLSLDVETPLEPDDTALLFGPTFAATLDAAVRGVASEPGTDFLLVDTQVKTSPFLRLLREYQPAKDFWRDMCAWRPEDGMPHNHAAFFLEFFVRLARWLDEDQGKAYPVGADCDWFHPSQEEYKNSRRYLRLRVGPTFADLLVLMEELWGKSPVPLHGKRLHNKVSKLLDQYIDYGQVVPCISMQGQRIFRKGEASFIDRDLLAAFWYMDIKAALGEPLEDIVSRLNPDQKTWLCEVMTQVDAE